MKKFLSLMLCILMILSLFACNGNTPDEGSTSSSAEETVTSAPESNDSEPEASEKEDEVKQENGNLTIMKDGEGLFTVIRPDVSTDVITGAAVSLIDAIEALTGNRIGIDTDYIKKTETLDNSALEILVGNTNRPDSVALAEKLGENQFAIKTTDTKIIIVGDNGFVLSAGVKYFIDTYLSSESSAIEFKEGTLVLRQSIEYFSAESFNFYKDLYESSDTLSSVCTQVIDVTKPSSSIKIPQGGYCDSNYFYQVFIKKDTSSNEVNNIDKIVKTDMATGKLVMTSPELDLNHANDVTYNSKINKFIVCHNNPYRTKLSLIDPETLTVTETVTIPCSIYSIDYNETKNVYVVGLSGGQTFRFLDENFQFIDLSIYQPTDRTKGYTTQGLACDDNYIYFVLYKSNVITVYDWDGNFVTLIELDVGSREPENISIVDGTIYVATTGGNGALLWEVVPKAKQ